MIGTTLGAYRILEPLGQGGMGVVYKATDTRLGRTVALKILPPAGAMPGLRAAGASEQRARRFLNEAQAASALNHPHIVTIHDIGREGEVDYIVMEYVVGRTLDRLVAGGPLPVDHGR